MDRRMIGLGVLGAGAVLAVIGALSLEWLDATERGMELRFGLREVALCGQGACKSVSMTDLPVDDLFSMSGNVAFFAALLGSALGVVGGAFSVSGRKLSASISPARLSIAFFAAAALAGVTYLATKPDELKGASIGWGAFLGIGGSLLGAAGALAVYRHEQLTERELAARVQTFG